MDQVIALFDFNSTDPGELSFKKGERLIVLDRKYEHWWLCKNGIGMSGVVPCNHVKLKSRLATESTLTRETMGSTPNRQSTPISKKMTARDVVAQLADHGCKDLTDGLDSSSFGEYPVMHGGFSDIYRGLLSDGVRVAVKALRVSADTITRDPKHLKRAARELHTWSKCNHPNVISLLGLALFRGRIGMIAPWMANGCLPRYLARVPGADRSNMSIQICEGLAYLHQVGIIHCDLKGANVLVSEEGNPVLTDFGNSSLVDRTLGFTETTSGPSFTLRWSAAEILEGNPSHTEASDVYALGMTIYETMTGKVPYHGKNDTSVFLLVTMKKELPERPEVMLNDDETSDKLWRLLVMCWSFEPAARPDAADVARTIRAITSNQETPLLQSTPSSSQNVLVYRPASAEAIAQAEALAAARRAEEVRRYHEHLEEVKYRERQAVRAAREAREAAAARKAFEEERRRLEEERRKREEERRKNEEQVVIASWQRYERGWQDLINGVNAEGRPLTFYDIPWPVSMPARSFEELQSSAIEKFLLNPCHSTTKTRKVRLRAALMQWHPDKFAQRFVDRIEESHRQAILTAVNSVARTITELMNKETDS